MLLTFYRTTPEGRTYYYSIHDRQTSLFDEYTYTAHWGASLASGRQKIFSFDSRAKMQAHLRKCVKQRIASGYKVLYSYFNKRSDGPIQEMLEAVG